MLGMEAVRLAVHAPLACQPGSTDLSVRTQAKMGLKLVVLDPTPGCPASSVAPQTVGSFRNADEIRSSLTSVAAAAWICSQLQAVLPAGRLQSPC